MNTETSLWLCGRVSPQKFGEDYHVARKGGGGGGGGGVTSKKETTHTYGAAFAFQHSLQCLYILLS